MWRYVLRLAPVLYPVALAAQSGPPPNYGCPGAEHRQFDFWLGTWDVTVNGNPAGKNLITLEEQTCLIHEHWTGSRGGSGQSFNFYDRQAGKWHQFWVDSQGSHIHLTGTYADGQMRFSGTAPGPSGRPQDQRLTFFKNPDGSVRQLWETSDDAGKTWQVAFDGLYRKGREGGS